MARKITHVVTALIILIFCISGFTALINYGDKGSGVDSSFIISNLDDLNTNLSKDNNELQYELGQKLDNTSSLEPLSTSNVENRGSSGFGIINLLSKNILTGFINKVGKALNIPSLVLIFFIGLISSTIIILFIRAYWGSDRT